MKDFRDLKVWEKAHELTLGIYRATMAFPREELYGLTSQVRRASVSTPSNIAEGCGRATDADFGRFLQMAMGSSCEVEYQLQLARDLDFLPEPEYSRLNALVVEVKRMLASLIQKVTP